MNAALAGVALAVVLGAIVATSARNARTAVLGLLLALIGASFAADRLPDPDPLGLAARIVGAVLAAYLLWVASRGGDVETAGSQLGWPAELLVAGAAAVAGYGSHVASGLGDGSAVAQAAGFALAALAVGPIVNGRDIFRIGIGLLLLVGGTVLVRTALAGDPGTLEQLAIAGLMAVVGGAVAAMAASARADGPAGYDLAGESSEPIRRRPDAHLRDG